MGWQQVKGTSGKVTEEAYGTERVVRFESMVMSFVSDRRKERQPGKKKHHVDWVAGRERTEMGVINEQKYGLRCFLSVHLCKNKDLNSIPETM